MSAVRHCVAQFTNTAVMWIRNTSSVVFRIIHAKVREPGGTRGRVRRLRHGAARIAFAAVLMLREHMSLWQGSLATWRGCQLSRRTPCEKMRKEVVYFPRD